MRPPYLQLLQTQRPGLSLVLEDHCPGASSWARPPLSCPPGKTFLAHHLVTPGSPGCAVPGPRRPGSHLCVLCLPSAPHPRCPAPLSVSLCGVQLSWRKKWPQAPVCPPGTPTTARGARRGPAPRGGVRPRAGRDGARMRACAGFARSAADP